MHSKSLKDLKRQLLVILIIYSCCYNAWGQDKDETLNYILNGLKEAGSSHRARTGDEGMPGYRQTFIEYVYYNIRSFGKPKPGLEYSYRRTVSGSQNFQHTGYSSIYFDEIKPEDIVVAVSPEAFYGDAFSLKVTSKNSKDRIFVIFSDQEKARRLANAFRHIAELYGAKADPFAN